MDWTTLRQLLYRQLHLDSSTVATAVKDDVGVAICEAIKFNRSDSYWFNMARGFITSKNGDYAYPLPTGFMSLIGPVYYTPAGSVDETRYQLQEATVDEIESQKFIGNDYNVLPRPGHARTYAVDMADMRLLTSPSSSADGDIFEFRYQIDPGTPRYRYSGSAWAFYEPDNETAISDTSTYTNIWFQDALDLTMWRALYYLWSSIYGGTEEATMKANLALQSWLEVKNKLRAETAKRMSKRMVRKYI